MTRRGNETNLKAYNKEIKDALTSIYKKNYVKAATIEQFFKLFYKTEKYDEAALIVGKKNVQMDGYTVISATDSVTGKLVSYVKGISNK